MSLEITPEIQSAIDSAVEAATNRLQAKNTELLGEVKKLRKGQEIDPQVVSELEAKLDEANTKLAEQTKVAKDALKTSETLKAQLQSESGYTQKLLVENGLNDALVGLGIKDPDYLAAAKAMFHGQAQVVIEGDNRTVKLGDKSLQDAMKEWGTTDAAKKFIAAPQNGGGGSQGGRGSNAGQKTVTRDAFNGMSHVERADFAKSGGSVVD